MLEPDALQDARPVLRGRGGSNASLLPDPPGIILRKGYQRHSDTMTGAVLPGITAQQPLLTRLEDSLQKGAAVPDGDRTPHAADSTTRCRLHHGHLVEGASRARRSTTSPAGRPAS